MIMTDIGDFYEPASAQRTACRKAIVNRVDVFVYAKRSARFCVIEYLIPGEHPGSRKLHRHLRLIEEDEEEYKVATHLHKGDEIKLSFDDEFEEFRPQPFRRRVLNYLFILSHPITDRKE